MCLYQPSSGAQLYSGLVIQATDPYLCSFCLHSILCPLVMEEVDFELGVGFPAASISYIALLLIIACVFYKSKVCSTDSNVLPSLWEGGLCFAA